MSLLWMLAVFTWALVGQAEAKCQCLCVEGQVRPVCTSPAESRPECPSRACPFPSRSPPPQLPLDAAACPLRQVFIPHRHGYEWRRICD